MAGFSSVFSFTIETSSWSRAISSRDGGDGAARAAPGGLEVDEDRTVLVVDVSLEGGVGGGGDGSHGSSFRLGRLGWWGGVNRAGGR